MYLIRVSPCPLFARLSDANLMRTEDKSRKITINGGRFTCVSTQASSHPSKEKCRDIRTGSIVPIFRIDDVAMSAKTAARRAAPALSGKRTYVTTAAHDTPICYISCAS